MAVRLEVGGVQGCVLARCEDGATGLHWRSNDIVLDRGRRWFNGALSLLSLNQGYDCIGGRSDDRWKEPSSDGISQPHMIARITNGTNAGPECRQARARIGGPKTALILPRACLRGVYRWTADKCSNTQSLRDNDASRGMKARLRAVRRSNPRVESAANQCCKM